MIKQYFASYAVHASNITVDIRRGQIEYHSNYAEPWRVTLVDTGQETMTGGRLKRLARYLDPGECFCMTYGDGVADIDIAGLIDFHRSHGRLATVTAVTPPGRFGALVLNGERVARFSEKPPGDGAFVNGGFFVLHPSVLERIAGDETVWEREPLEGLAQAGELAAFRHGGFWHPMDTLRDRMHLEALWESGRAPWKTWCH
jgi:glucose-1-phosphate cytidylyltransferase